MDFMSYKGGFYLFSVVFLVLSCFLLSTFSEHIELMLVRVLFLFFLGNELNEV